MASLAKGLEPVSIMPKQARRTSRYCASCSVYWPPTVEYRRCGECGGETYGVIGMEPIPTPEAESRVKHARFELYYHGTHERNRKGPTPEQAAVLIDLERRATAPDPEVEPSP